MILILIFTFDIINQIYIVVTDRSDAVALVFFTTRRFMLSLTLLFVLVFFQSCLALHMYLA